MDLKKVKSCGNVAELIEQLQKMPQDGPLVGNTVDKEGIWYTYPVGVFKVSGDNNMVCIYLVPTKQMMAETEPDPQEGTTGTPTKSDSIKTS